MQSQFLGRDWRQEDYKFKVSMGPIARARGKEGKKDLEETKNKRKKKLVVNKMEYTARVCSRRKGRGKWWEEKKRRETCKNSFIFIHRRELVLALRINATHSPA